MNTIETSCGKGIRIAFVTIVVALSSLTQGCGGGVDDLTQTGAPLGTTPAQDDDQDDTADATESVTATRAAAPADQPLAGDVAGPGTGIVPATIVTASASVTANLVTQNPADTTVPGRGVPVETRGSEGGVNDTPKEVGNESGGLKPDPSIWRGERGLRRG